ncbi:MAG: sensor histidine kinase, partial [Candidatus Onthomonas sp.]
RLFDNLFSNIEKYADPGQPVTISQELVENFIRVELHNFVPPNPNPVESTNIGLKTCERIVQQLGGVFQFWKEETEFTVKLTIPVYQEEAEQTG